MAQKPLRGRHRARNLALPFVVTAATACTVRPAAEEPTPKAQPAARPTVQGEAPTAGGNATKTEGSMQTISNPPPPTATTGESEVGVTSNPPPPAPALPAAPASGGHVIVDANGTCSWLEDVTCPPKSVCNPPPPKAVQCPETSK